MGSAASKSRSRDVAVFPQANTEIAIAEALVSSAFEKKPSLLGVPGSKGVASEVVRADAAALMPAQSNFGQHEATGESRQGRQILYEGTLVAIKAVGDEDGRPRALAHVQLVVSWPEDLFQANNSREVVELTPKHVLATVVALRVDSLLLATSDFPELKDPKPFSVATKPSRSTPQSSSSSLQQQQLQQQPIPSLSIPPGLEPRATFRCSSAATSLSAPCLSTASHRRRDPMAASSWEISSPSRATSSRTITSGPSRSDALPPIVPAAASAAGATTASSGGFRDGALLLIGAHWSGEARDGPQGPLKLRSCAPPGAVAPAEVGPQALTLELLPQPFLFHFAIAYKRDEAAELRDELVQQLGAISRRTRPLRVWDMMAAPPTPMGVMPASPTPASASSRPNTSPSEYLRAPPSPTSPKLAPARSTTADSCRAVGAAAVGAAFPDSCMATSADTPAPVQESTTNSGTGISLLAAPRNLGSAGVAANLLVLLSPGVWDCEEVVSALRQVRDTAAASSSTASGLQSKMNINSSGSRVLLLYVDAAEAFGGCHVPMPRSSSSPVPELLDIAARVALDPCKALESAPEDLATVLAEADAIPYRLHPHAATAAARHIAQMGGCGTRLQRAVTTSEIGAYLSPAPADAPPPRPYHRPGGARKLPAYYYEGVALRPSDPRDPATEGLMLRGSYQAVVTFDSTASQIKLDLSYVAKISESMPSYNETITLHWQRDGGSGCDGGTVVQVGELPPGRFRGRWEGRLAALGGEMRLAEDRDDIVLRPQPFFFHFYIAGAQDALASGLCGQLANGMQERSCAGRRLRLYESCGRSQDERHAAMDCSAAVLAALTRTCWTDAAFCTDIKRAAAAGRRVLFVYDADPGMLSHVDPGSAVRGAPPGVISALLAASDVYPYFRQCYEQEACLRQLLAAAGLPQCQQPPTDTDQFLCELRESQSDLEGLILLRERRWVYYEGVAERAGNVYGWYQVDAKFKPDLDLVELWMDFESKHPGSNPSCRASYLVDWTRSNNTVAEREGRWRGRVGGMGGAFSLVTSLGDNIRLSPQPHIWHYFLSYEQRETAGFCAVLAGLLADLSAPGRRLRCWCSRQGPAVHRNARALCVAHAQHFVLLLSPSALRSADIRFDIGVALSLHKSTLVLYDPDPNSRTHVDLFRARAAAAHDLRPLFDGPCLPWPGFRDHDTGVLVRDVMEIGGFGDLFRSQLCSESSDGHCISVEGAV